MRIAVSFVNGKLAAGLSLSDADGANQSVGRVGKDALINPDVIMKVRNAAIRYSSVLAWALATVGALGFVVAPPTAPAQSISVPNYSFELQSGVGYPFGTNPNIDAWQKIDEPAYFTPAFGSFGIPWYGTAGVFVDNNPYGNRVGTQAGYILAFPQVSLFQDYDSSPTHDFNATFEIGQAYNLTVGIFGKNSIQPGSTLELSLYYRNDQGDKVAVGSTVITYSADAFPVSTYLNFIDFQVNVGPVQPGDAWAGKHIGIQLESTIPIELTSGGNWDFDNVRLTAVPEPTALALLGLGLGGLVLGRMRDRA